MADKVVVTYRTSQYSSSRWTIYTRSPVDLLQNSHFVAPNCHHWANKYYICRASPTMHQQHLLKPLVSSRTTILMWPIDLSCHF